MLSAQAHDLLGITLKQAGREKEAEASYREAIALYRALGDAAIVKLAYPLGNLGVLLGEEGRYAESSELVGEGLAILRKHLPPDHPDTLSLELNQAGALMGQHHALESEQLLRHVLEARTRILGPNHKDTLHTAVELADCLAEQHRYLEAARLCRPAAEGLERGLGFEHAVTLFAWNTYSTAACQTDQAADGLAALRRVEAARMKLYGPADWHSASTRVAIGTCLVALGRNEEALSTLLQAVRELEAARGPSFHRTQAAYQALGDLYARLGRAEERARWAAKILPPPSAPLAPDPHP